MNKFIFENWIFIQEEDRGHIQICNFTHTHWELYSKDFLDGAKKKSSGRVTAFANLRPKLHGGAKSWNIRETQRKGGRRLDRCKVFNGDLNPSSQLESISDLFTLYVDHTFSRF